MVSFVYYLLGWSIFCCVWDFFQRHYDLKKLISKKYVQKYLKVSNPALLFTNDHNDRLFFSGEQSSTVLASPFLQGQRLSGWPRTNFATPPTEGSWSTGAKLWISHSQDPSSLWSAQTEGPQWEKLETLQKSRIVRSLRSARACPWPGMVTSSFFSVFFSIQVNR